MHSRVGHQGAKPDPNTQVLAKQVVEGTVHPFSRGTNIKSFDDYEFQAYLPRRELRTRDLETL